MATSCTIQLLYGGLWGIKESVELFTYLTGGSDKALAQISKTPHLNSIYREWYIAIQVMSVRSLSLCYWNCQISCQGFSETLSLINMSVDYSTKQRYENVWNYNHSMGFCRSKFGRKVSENQRWNPIKL